MEERGRDEEKKGKKNHRDPVIPLGEAHFLLFNLCQSAKSIREMEGIIELRINKGTPYLFLMGRGDFSRPDFR